MYENAKARIYDILVETDDRETVDRIVAIILMIIILINVVAVVLETVDELNTEYAEVFYFIEIVSVAFFSIEYILRLWIAPLNPKFAGRFGRIRYAFSAMAIIDLLAILPFFIPMFISVDLRILRFLRVFRLFRLLKMNRYVASLNILDDVVKAKKEELFVTLSMTSILLLFASSFMYLLEHEAQADKFPNIPAAMWWGIATLTTVGYGDVFPITPLGKILGAFVAILGIGMFALPAGILASGFAEEISKKHRVKESLACPHCGKEISDENYKA